MENPVRETTKEIISSVSLVKINQEKIIRLADDVSKEGVIMPEWSQEFHVLDAGEDSILDYLFLVGSLNFCFWSKSKIWRVSRNGKNYDGSRALAAVLKYYFENQRHKANLRHFSEINFSEFEEIFSGEGELLWLKERWRILREVSRFLLENYGSSRAFVESAGEKCSILVPKIANELPSFSDEINYNGKKVYFWKRAQLLCSDIHGSFRGRGIGHFGDMKYLTAFADYKIPQILRHFGILEYASEFSGKISQKVLIPSGSQEEVEIRSATVWAIEYLAQALNERDVKILPFQVDWLLWNKCQEVKMEEPYHLTETIFY